MNKLTPEEIPELIKQKYPHMFQGNDELWCIHKINHLSELLSNPAVQELLELQLQKLKDMTPDEVVEEIAHEVCLVCVHKPTKIYKSMDNSPDVIETGCYKGFEGKEYCSIVQKVAREIAIFKVVEREVLKDRVWDILYDDDFYIETKAINRLSNTIADELTREDRDGN